MNTEMGRWQPRCNSLQMFRFNLSSNSKVKQDMSSWVSVISPVTAVGVKNISCLTLSSYIMNLSLSAVIISQRLSSVNLNVLVILITPFSA